MLCTGNEINSEKRLKKKRFRSFIVLTAIVKIKSYSWFIFVYLKTESC